MPEVIVTHPDINGDAAKEPPKREPVPEGEYDAVVIQCSHGVTRDTPPVKKFTIEYQIIHQVVRLENGEIEQDTQQQGRRVWQDYIPVFDPNKRDLNDLRRYELRMLLDATGIEKREVNGHLVFNTDGFVGKTLRITVANRKKVVPMPGDPLNVQTYTNVTKVDTTESPSEDELV